MPTELPATCIASFYYIPKDKIRVTCKVMFHIQPHVFPFGVETMELFPLCQVEMIWDVVVERQLTVSIAIFFFFFAIYL